MPTYHLPSRVLSLSLLFVALGPLPLFLPLAKKPCPPVYSHRDSNMERPFDFRHDAVAPFVVPGGDGAAAAVRFARDDALLVAVPVRPMYRSCIEATPPNDASAVDGAADGHVTYLDFLLLHGIANTGLANSFF